MLGKSKLKAGRISKQGKMIGMPENSVFEGEKRNGNENQ